MKRPPKIETSFGLLLFVLVALTIGVFYVFRKPAVAPTIVNTNAPVSDILQTGTVTTFNEVRTKSFVRSTPDNNAMLGVSPNTVALALSSVLGPESNVAVTNRDGQPVQLGSTTFSNDRQSMSALLRTGLTGPYTVTYWACNLDHACESGTFGFVVQKNQ